MSNEFKGDYSDDIPALENKVSELTHQLISLKATVQVIKDFVLRNVEARMNVDNRLYMLEKKYFLIDRG